MSANKFDLVILGSGSTAFAAAHRAAELGKTAAMTENRTLGGTCVNRGCLPSKNLIEAARIYWEARHPRYPGLKPATMGLDFHRLISQKDEIVADFREKKYQSGVTADGSIQVFYGDAAFIFPHAVQVGETVLESDRFLIATGSRPAIPDISGLAETPFLTSDLLTVNEGLELWELPESLIIVGAGYIALELGQMFAHLGSRVTLLERGDQILSRYEPEIGLEMQHLLAEEGITVLLRTSVNAVQRGGNGIEVDVTVDGKRRRLAAERLLVATGRVPNTADIGLEQAGVATIPGGWVKVDSNLRTSAVHIFAAGDAIGPQTDNQLATPVGAHDGGIAAANALTSQPKSVDHRVIPRVIFTDPQ
ncbi:MAG: FAD-dependent oxidoreductase, partial [Chloroflexi bacterium]|nr:FAD-dependent oxidoreductase [Chloroflexota bacterium]